MAGLKALHKQELKGKINLEIKPIYISSNEFKNYKNIIVHYRGNFISQTQI